MFAGNRGERTIPGKAVWPCSRNPGHRQSVSRRVAGGRQYFPADRNAPRTRLHDCRISQCLRAVCGRQHASLNRPLILFLLSLVLLSSCARHKAEPQALYDAAERLFLRGDLGHARTQAHSAYEQFAGNNLGWAWNFRLLEAEIMTDQGLPQDVLVALNSEPAQASSNPELSVRRHMLRALAFAHLGDFPHAHQDLQTALELCPDWNCKNAGKLARIAGAVA